MGVRRGRRIAATVAAAAVLGGALNAADAAAGQGHGDGILPPGDWTDEQVAEAHRIVMENEELLAAFADASQLEARGFYDFGVTAPGGWDHWINPAWMADDVYLDPTRPESLVFRHADNGEYVLEAAMYILPEGYDMSNIPAEVAWLPGWHTHDNICIDDDGRFSGLTDPDGTCYSGHPLDWPPMMHVWIVDNPCGHRFAGIDVGGIECGHHNPDPPRNEPPNDPEQPPHRPPNDPEQPGRGPDRPRPAPPSIPVPGQPSLYG